jgi:hypothetical protein
MLHRSAILFQSFAVAAFAIVKGREGARPLAPSCPECLDTGRRRLDALTGELEMKLGFAATIAAGAVVMVAAGPVQAQTVHYSTALTGASEVPPNTAAESGTVEADLDTATRTFSYTVTYAGLTGPAMAAHFHGPAAAGVNAPPIITIKDLASPIKGNAVLTADQMADLQAGKWYFNVHTKAHPGGEIRGQLKP